MRFINNRFENQEYKEELNLDNHIQNMMKFISGFGLSEELLEQIYLDSKKFIIEYTDGKTYEVKYNDSIEQLKFPSSVSAFSTLIEQKRVENGFEVTPGIGLRNNISDNIHTFTH